MRAVIMAGGEGTRLAPLTSGMPKPLARLCGRPVIEYILDLLARHKITSASIATGFLAQMIKDYFEENPYEGVRLEFVAEPKPLGTAGSVKNAVTEPGGEIIVISGDAMCDFNLEAAIEAHRHSGASATVILKEVADPREYGLVTLNQDMTIAGFLEKPAYSQAVSNLANTGVYILSEPVLDMIPPGVSYDFAKDLFPKMLAGGVKMLGHIEKGYWCDIGDLQSYSACQRDMLYGRVEFLSHARRTKEGSLVMHEPQTSGYSVISPVYIGKNVTIERGAVITAGSVLDDGCYIGENTIIDQSVILQNAVIKERCRIERSLVCHCALVKGLSQISQECAVGSEAVIGTGAMLKPGVRIWPGRTLEDNTTLSDHLRYSDGRRGCFDEEGVQGETGLELNAAVATKLGLAAGTVLQGKTVAIAHNGQASAKVLAGSVAAAVASCGVEIFDAGALPKNQFQFICAHYEIDTGIYLSGGQQGCVSFFAKGGLPQTRSFERSFEAVMARGEFRHAQALRYSEPVRLAGAERLYKLELKRIMRTGEINRKIEIASPSKEIEQMFKKNLSALGAEIASSDIVLHPSVDATQLSINDSASGLYLNHYKLVAICAVFELLKGKTVALSNDFPPMVDDLSKRYGGRILRYYSCPVDESDSEARKIAETQLWTRDALMLAAKLFAGLNEHSVTLKQAAQILPDFAMAVKVVSAGTNPSEIMNRFLKMAESRDIKEGVTIDDKLGTIAIRPLKRGSAIKIMVQSAKYETAMELCERVADLIEGE